MQNKLLKNMIANCEKKSNAQSTQPTLSNLKIITKSEISKRIQAQLGSNSTVGKIRSPSNSKSETKENPCSESPLIKNFSGRLVTLSDESEKKRVVNVPKDYLFRTQQEKRGGLSPSLGGSNFFLTKPISLRENPKSTDKKVTTPATKPSEPLKGGDSREEPKVQSKTEKLLLLYRKNKLLQESSSN
jgi:hypothetical protein